MEIVKNCVVEIVVGKNKLTRSASDWVVSEKVVVQDENSKNFGKETWEPIAYCGTLERAIIRMKQSFLENAFVDCDNINDVELDVLDKLKTLNDIVNK